MRCGDADALVLTATAEIERDIDAIVGLHAQELFALLEVGIRLELRVHAVPAVPAPDHADLVG